LNGRTGHRNNKARGVCEVSFRGLTVVVSAVTYSTAGGSNCELSALKLITGSVSELSGFINDLIESREDIISELHLSDGGCASASSTDREASDTLLRQGSVENSIGSIFLIQSHGASENTTKFDIFAKYNSRVILFQGQVQSVGDGGPEIHLLDVGWVFEFEFLNV
jgi:hypothetical protein